MKPTGIEKLVCEEISRRQALGIAKYGKTVANNPLDLREWLVHHLEELLDAAVYVRRAIAEIDANVKPIDLERSLAWSPVEKIGEIKVCSALSAKGLIFRARFGDLSTYADSKAEALARLALASPYVVLDDYEPEPEPEPEAGWELESSNGVLEIHSRACPEAAEGKIWRASSRGVVRYGETRDLATSLLRNARKTEIKVDDQPSQKESRA